MRQQSLYFLKAVIEMNTTSPTHWRLWLAAGALALGLAACGGSEASPLAVGDDAVSESAPATDTEPVEVAEQDSAQDDGPIVSEEAVPASTTTTPPSAEEPSSDAPTTDPPPTDDPTSDEAVQDDSSTALVEPAPIFDSVIDELADSPVPIRLPSSIGDSEGLFASVPLLDENGYLVTIDLSADCNGGGACTTGSVSGRLLSDSIPLTAGVEVPLPGGRTGFFYDATCGASCGDGFIAWIEGDVQYTVGSKLAPGPDMLEWAWATLGETPAPIAPTNCDGGVEVDGDMVLVEASNDFADLYWIVTCSSDGRVTPELADAPVTPISFDGIDGVIGLERPDGSLQFMSSSIPLLDQSGAIATTHRLTITNLLCADTDNDGDIELIDTDRLLSFPINPPFFPTEIFAEDIEDGAPC